MTLIRKLPVAFINRHKNFYRKGFLKKKQIIFEIWNQNSEDIFRLLFLIQGM